MTTCRAGGHDLHPQDTTSLGKAHIDLSDSENIIVRSADTKTMLRQVANEVHDMLEMKLPSANDAALRANGRTRVQICQPNSKIIFFIIEKNR